MKYCTGSVPGLQNCTVDSVVENLNPIDVQALFRRINENDFWLLGMQFER